MVVPITRKKKQLQEDGINVYFILISEVKSLGKYCRLLLQHFD